MPTGYTVPGEGAEDGSMRARIAWDMPERYNIARHALDQDNGDAVALTHFDETGTAHTFTYAELDRASDAVAARLHADGVGCGDRVGLCLPECPELLLGHLAAFKLGAVVIPFSVISGSESVAYRLDHSDPTALIVGEAEYDRFGDVFSKRDHDAELVLEIDGEQYGVPRGSYGGFRDDVDPGAAPEFRETLPDDPAVLVYTSGTSGHPKGVLQSHQFLLGSLPGYRFWFHLFDDHHDERVWTPAAWSWAGALFDVVFPTLATGGTVVGQTRRSGFDPSTALALVERASISRAFLPPTALRQIRQQTDPSAFDLSSLSVVMCGGEHLPPAHLEWGERALDVTINESYGLTEANALIGNCQAAYDCKPGSMGRAYPGHSIRLVDEDGAPVDDGDVGEIALELPDPTAFTGYWKDEEATQQVITDDGLLLTGDLARRDEDGYYHHQGRADDVIITSGYRVSPKEVEQALEETPWVKEAIVGGVPDEDRGQRVKAYLVPASEVQQADDERRREIMDEVVVTTRERIGAYKAPRELELLQNPPMTYSGKIDREALFVE